MFVCLFTLFCFLHIGKVDGRMSNKKLHGLIFMTGCLCFRGSRAHLASSYCCLIKMVLRHYWLGNLTCRAREENPFYGSQISLLAAKQSDDNLGDAGVRGCGHLSLAAGTPGHTVDAGSLLCCSPSKCEPASSGNLLSSNNNNVLRKLSGT